MSLVFEDVSPQHKLITIPGIANETLEDNYMAVQFYGSNNSIRLPQNPTAEVHGIAQHAVDTGQEVVVVVYGMTKFRSNGTIYFWDPIINNASSGELVPNALHANESKGTSVVLGRCFKQIANNNTEKISIMMFDPDNCT